MKDKEMFPKIKGRVLFHEPLFKHTTFRIGGLCGIWAQPRNEEDLKKIVMFAKSKGKKIVIIGRGSNILPSDKGFDGIAIHIGAGCFDEARFVGSRLIAGAGVALNRLINLACKRGLKGLEGLAGIPGTVGGAIFMNSSYRGRISDCLEEVRAMDLNDGAVITIKRKNLKFGYRHSNLRGYIILSATLRLKRASPQALLKQRDRLLAIKTKKQPLGCFSAGCVFKNPDGGTSAAWYIEKSNLKGKRIGDAQISERHANFIVNLKNARQRDVMRLISFAKKRVKAKFGVDLVPEIVVI
ncbi:MAG: UDP-N-acetylenolpyruvoylglucosamine reductase [Omnitrophica bacterium RBG_13_46_9]|nr:MAG: UDP-N-acetylenolpyruvoylglucosamine reductase [Omnitrophica bacterium RBG_13_46_9]